MAAGRDRQRQLRRHDFLRDIGILDYVEQSASLRPAGKRQPEAFLRVAFFKDHSAAAVGADRDCRSCLLYTSPSAYTVKRPDGAKTPCISSRERSLTDIKISSSAM